MVKDPGHSHMLIARSEALCTYMLAMNTSYQKATMWNSFLRHLHLFEEKNLFEQTTMQEVEENISQEFVK